MFASTSAILAFTLGQYLLGFMLIMVCMLLILIVLLQKGRGEGLAGAFGGSSGSAFGAKTGDVFTWITVCLFGAYMALAVFANYAFVPGDEPLKQEVLTTPGMPAPTSLPITVTPGQKPPPATQPVAPPAPAEGPQPASDNQSPPTQQPLDDGAAPGDSQSGEQADDATPPPANDQDNGS